MINGARHEEQIKCGACGKPIVASQLRNHFFLVHTEIGKEQSKTNAERYGKHGRKKVYNGLGNIFRSWW